MKTISEQLTILVPTRDRRPFLARLLAYYASTGCRVPLYVLDSSAESGERSLGFQHPNAAVRFSAYPPPINFFTKVRQGLEAVRTPYAVLWADDDFLIPDALENAVRFLESHRDFSVAHGYAALVQLVPEGVKALGPYPQRSLTNGSASQRLLDHFTDSTAMVYSVHRTDDFRQNVAQAEACGLRHFWQELMLDTLSIIHGKAMRMEALYMLRQAHESMESVQLGKQTDIFDLVIAPGFSSDFAVFAGILTKELAQQDRISLEEAHAIAKRGFWDFLSKALQRKWRSQYLPALPGKSATLRRFIGQVPGMRSMAAILRAATSRRRYLSLNAVQHPASFFHKDFMSVVPFLKQPRESVPGGEIRMGGACFMNPAGHQPRVLIIGASGQLGSNLFAHFLRTGQAVGTYFQHPQPGLEALDIRDAAAVRRQIEQSRPVWIFLPAAQCHVDWCEDHEAESWAMNVQGTENVAREAARADARFVFFSTDHVFNGNGKPLYKEEDPVAPLSVYARHKVEAEQCIRKALPEKHLIVRSGWVYGMDPQRKNFVLSTLKRLRTGGKIRVPNDQFGSPTYAPDLVMAAEKLLQLRQHGLFHVVGPEWMTRLAFAQKIADTFGFPREMISGVDTAELRQGAPRALRVRLSTTKFELAAGVTLHNPGAGLLELRDQLQRTDANSCMQTHS